MSVYVHPVVGDPAQSAWFLTPPRHQPPVDVLLVEDDEDIAEMYRRRLVAEGLNVVLAGDARTAIDRLRADPVRTILLDLRLPNEDGFHVLQHIRSDAHLSSIPVLVLSNYGEPSTVRRAIEMGAAEYLVKANVTPIEVAARVRSYLGGGATQ